MKTIIYTCPYVPAEWIAAHGLRPSRVIPAATGFTDSLGRIEGVCPYVRKFANQVTMNTQISGVVMTTVCDQMRRAFDIIVRRNTLPVFLMNIPSTWQSTAAHKLYLDELRRLGRFLIRLGGKPPSNSDLAEIMLEYNTKRALILAVRKNLTSRQYSEAIAKFNQDSKSNITGSVTDKESLTGGVSLAIIGGPLLREDFDIFDVVENSGGRIVLDATETGERGMCGRFDHHRVHDNPLIELAIAYFGSIPDASRRPNSQLYDWFECKLAHRGVRGIIFRRYTWCDIWHAELYRLKQWTKLPVLDMDVNGDEKDLSTRTTQRIKAFVEMF
ncbi:MAG: 2-hydroxyacyl-CoA dehydratase [Planctomycetota bacterium]|jgi:benzoyl-CoA reductase/2-hydroxyglutaryl-CoA dehydratase subunit BcrC/BadD/HgdB